MAAPVIAFTSSPGDPTPSFSLNIDPPTIGDIMRLEWSSSATFTTTDGTAQNTLDSTEGAGLTFNLTVGTIYNGRTYFRMVNLSDPANYSNTLSDTISGGASRPQPGGGGASSAKRGLITAPPRIVWSKKKSTSAVAQVTEAVQQVAKVYPQYRMDFKEEWRHIANLLLADQTLAQLRKIETAKELADKIAQVIEEDDEEVLLLM